MSKMVLLYMIVIGLHNLHTIVIYINHSLSIFYFSKLKMQLKVQRQFFISFHSAQLNKEIKYQLRIFLLQ